jgi:hypothetical protein
MRPSTFIIFISILDVARTNPGLRQGAREGNEIAVRPRKTVFLARVTRFDPNTLRVSSGRDMNWPVFQIVLRGHSFVGLVLAGRHSHRHWCFR